MVYKFKCGFLSDGYNNASEGEREESQSGQLVTGRMESDEHYNSAQPGLHACTCMFYSTRRRKILFGKAYSSDNSGDGPGGSRRGNRNGSVGSGQKRSPQITPALRAELDKMINRKVTKSEELKTAFFQSTINVGGYNYTNFSTNMVRSITPASSNAVSIAQGTGQGDRIGNKIHIKKAYLKLASWVMPYQAITNPTPTPLMVRLWIFTIKNTIGLPTTLPIFFQAGDSSISPIGNILDYNYQVNSDVYTLYKTVDFKLGYSAFVASPGGIGGNGYYSNNDFNMCDLRTIDVTPWITKTIDFNDTTTIPFSKSLFFWVEAVCADGTTQSSGTYGAQINYQVILEYTDA